MKKLSTRDIVYIAMYAALFVALDRLTDMVSLFKMPQGGKLNFATVVLLLSSYHLGWKKGAIVGVVACVLMFATGSITYYGILSLLLDYVLGYIGYGFADLFPNFGVFYTGVLITSLFRLGCSTLAGCIVWESELMASLSYNASYMVPTMIVDLIMVPLIHKALQPVMGK